MCHKLLQVYACGHNKTICTTPCPHAIATGRRIPSNRGNAPDLSRSSSVVSAMAPSSPVPPARRTDVQDLPSQRGREPQAHPFPLRAAVLGSQAQQQQQGGSNAPAFRFMAPGTGSEAAGAGSGYMQSHPTSPASMSPTSPTPSQPSPTFSTTGTLIDAPFAANTSLPSTFFTPADPEVDDSDVDPNFCAYHFPRYLPGLRVPCKGCYPQPQWEGQRDAWMKSYREQHPGFKDEDVEQLSGVGAIMERFG